MAAGEYVSVCSLSDTEKADMAPEKSPLKNNIEFKEHELAEIYQYRWLKHSLAKKLQCN